MGAEPTNVNDIPLGQKTLVPIQSNDVSSAATRSQELENEPAAGIMMASLSNKNKRRGFKNALVNPVPTKIVFDDSAPVASGSNTRTEPDALPFSGTSTNEMTKAAPTTRPRLIPPSEKQEKGLLPPNMFVTSVDVEEDMWSRKRKKKKARAPTPDAEVEYLDYGGAEEDEVFDLVSTQRTTEPAPVKSSIPIQEIGKRWDQLVKVTNRSQVIAGTLIAWKVCLIIVTLNLNLDLTFWIRSWVSILQHSLRRCC